MPILLCFQKKSKVAMYRRLSEARNLACIRRYGLQTSEVPAPASPPASAFGTFPAPARGQVSRPGPHRTPMPSDSGCSRLNRARQLIYSGAGCLDRALCTPRRPPAVGIGGSLAALYASPDAGHRACPQHASRGPLCRLPMDQCPRRFSL